MGPVRPPSLCRAFWASASRDPNNTTWGDGREAARRLEHPNAAPPHRPFLPCVVYFLLSRGKERTDVRRPKMAPALRSVLESGPVAKLLSLSRVSWARQSRYEMKASLSLSLFQSPFIFILIPLSSFYITNARLYNALLLYVGFLYSVINMQSISHPRKIMMKEKVLNRDQAKRKTDERKCPF